MKSKIKVFLLIIFLCGITIFAFKIRFENERIFNKGTIFLENGDYYEAVELLSKIKGFKDTSIYLDEAIIGSKYLDSKNLMDAGDYILAIEELENLNGFKDSKDLIIECKYQQGITDYNNSNYYESIKYLSDIKNYKDSKTILNKSYLKISADISETVYQDALKKIDNDEYQLALEDLTLIQNYKDSKNLYELCESKIKN